MNADVYMIWAIDLGMPEEPWLVAAWDEFSIDNNPEGWEYEVAKAYKEHSHDEVKVIKTVVEYEAIVALFNTTPTVDSSGIEVVS